MAKSRGARDFNQRGYDYGWKHDSSLNASQAAALFDRNYKPSDFRSGERPTFSTAKREFVAGYKHAVTVLAKLPRTTNPSPSIRAQVRRLASGQIQLKIPLKRGENALRKAHELAKALGRKVVSVARAGGKTLNPGKAYWQYPWVVAVDSGSVGMTAALSRGFNTEEQAKAYIQQLKARSLRLGRAIQLLHNTGTNAPGGVKVVSSKSY